MPNTELNLAQQLIISEIENVLDDYPAHPYQQAFTSPKLRQELIVYVLSRITDKAGVIASATPRLKYNSACWHLAEKPYINILIHQGIYCILQPQPEQLKHAASCRSWFSSTWQRFASLTNLQKDDVLYRHKQTARH